MMIPLQPQPSSYDCRSLVRLSAAWIILHSLTNAPEGVISVPQSRSLSLKTQYASSKIRDNKNEDEDDDWSN
jgi:hypothetical protein